MRYISSDEVLSSVSDRDLVAAMARAFKLHSRGTGTSCQMSAYDPGGDLVFGHACKLPGLGTAVKTGVQLPGNRARGIPTVQAGVLLFDDDSGSMVAVVDGASVTALRTAGALVAAVATVPSVAHPKVGVLGYGPQGATAARLATSVLNAASVNVYAPSMVGCPPVEHLASLIEFKASAREAYAGADIVLCCTSSSSPVVSKDGLSSNAVIGSLNSYEPHLVEFDPAILSTCSVVLADVPAKEYGPLAQLSRSTRLPQVQSPTGDILPCRPEGRAAVFIGGTGYQDALASWSALIGWPAVERRIRVPSVGEEPSGDA